MKMNLGGSRRDDVHNVFTLKFRVTHHLTPLKHYPQNEGKNIT